MDNLSDSHNTHKHDICHMTILVYATWADLLELCVCVCMCLCVLENVTRYTHLHNTIYMQERVSMICKRGRKCAKNVQLGGLLCFSNFSNPTTSQHFHF